MTYTTEQLQELTYEELEALYIQLQEDKPKYEGEQYDAMDAYHEQVEVAMEVAQLRADIEKHITALVEWRGSRAEAVQATKNAFNRQLDRCKRRGLPMQVRLVYGGGNEVAYDLKTFQKAWKLITK